jgi:hypothetical protein
VIPRPYNHYLRLLAFDADAHICRLPDEVVHAFGVHTEARDVVLTAHRRKHIRVARAGDFASMMLILRSVLTKPEYWSNGYSGRFLLVGRPVPSQRRLKIVLALESVRATQEWVICTSMPYGDSRFERERHKYRQLSLSAIP